MNRDNKENILFKPYPKLNITEKTKENVLKHPSKHLNCDVRVRMGKFYTTSEFERRSKEVLDKTLPGVKKLRLRKKYNR